ncbi:MAG: CBS domain-containing protein [Actinobacteria bacterium]|nr:MAG: CBS domain-containing protein [Actinomycetota bacterium]
MSKVREAMVPEPRTLDAEAPATEAGELLARPEVRAVFVSRAGQFVGVLTRKTLVREIVAPGLDPKTTAVGPIAEAPHYTIDSEMDLEEAFRFLEEHDAERVPVVEDGRLVGVLARELVQRRLAEDESPEPLDETPS